MSTTQQPEALNLEEFRAKVTHAAREPLLARIAELEAQLSAIGAGGVEPLRKAAPATRQAWQWIGVKTTGTCCQQKTITTSSGTWWGGWQTCADTTIRPPAISLQRITAKPGQSLPIGAAPKTGQSLPPKPWAQRCMRQRYAMHPRCRVF